MNASDATPEAYGLEYVRLDEIARLAALASSYWRSVELAADRGDALTVAVHCRQAASVTREVLLVLKALGSQEAEPP